MQPIEGINNMTKNKFKKFAKIFVNFLLVLFVIVLTLVVFTAIDIPGFNYYLFTVNSGSMSPAIRTGSIVLVSPRESYQEGEIITFKSEAEKDVVKPRFTTTHRIVGTRELEDKEVFVTKGDANDAQDSMGVDKALVVGKVLFNVPLIGYVISAVKSQTGFILLIIIPATIIIYSEVNNIKNEIQKLIKNSKKKNEKQN